MMPRNANLSQVIDDILSRYHHSACNQISTPMFSSRELSVERRNRLYKYLIDTESLLSELQRELEWKTTMSDEVGV